MRQSWLRTTDRRLRLLRAGLLRQPTSGAGSPLPHLQMPRMTQHPATHPHPAPPVPHRPRSQVISENFHRKLRFNQTSTSDPSDGKNVGLQRSVITVQYCPAF